MKILLLNDTLHVAHHGCQATSTGLRCLLQERFPGAEITPDHLHARRVWECLSVPLLQRQLFSQLIPVKGSRWDYVIANGEGSLHACGRPLKRRNGAFILRLLQMQQAMAQGARGWIVNHSLYSNRSDYLQLLRNVYGHLEHIAVREPFSYDVACRVADHDVTQAADCAFLTPLPEPAAQSPLADSIVLTDSSIRSTGRSLQNLGQLCQRLRNLTGRPVVYLSILTDGRDAHRVAKPLGLPYHFFVDTATFLAHLQCSALVLAGRYHMAVFAALCGVPFLPMRANTPKNSGLLALLDYPVPCIDPEHLDIDSAVDAITRLLADGTTTRNFLTGQRERLRALARNNVPDHSTISSTT